MKQIEITVDVNQNIEEVAVILEQQGFSKIRTSYIDDLYLSQNLSKLNVENIIEILSNAILLRYLNENGNVYKKITYKSKKYKDNVVVFEEKINLNCDDLITAEKLFKAINFDELVRVKYEVVVFEKDGVELAFQNVDGLGLLLEFESKENVEEISDEEILNKKNDMKKDLQNYGIALGSNIDIKKAYELIKKSLQK